MMTMDSKPPPPPSPRPPHLLHHYLHRCCLYCCCCRSQLHWKGHHHQFPLPQLQQPDQLQQPQQPLHPSSCFSPVLPFQPTPTILLWFRPKLVLVFYLRRTASSSLVGFRICLGSVWYDGNEEGIGGGRGGVLEGGSQMHIRCDPDLLSAPDSCFLFYKC